MESLKKSIEVIEDIVNNGNNFHSALKKCFENESKNKSISSSDISALCGCYLRHFIVFNRLIDDNFENIDSSLRITLGLVLSNGLFLKRLSKEDTFNFLKTTVDSLNTKFDLDKFEKIYDSKVNGEPLIDIPYEKDDKNYQNYLISPDFVSQRYNIEPWIYSMWKKQFGTNKALKTAKCLQKTLPTYVLVNSLKNDKLKLLESYKDDLIDTEKSDVLKYDKKEPIRRKNFLITNRSVVINYSLKEILDELDIDIIKPVYFYLGNLNNIFLDLCFKFKNNLHLDCFITPNKDLYNFRSLATRYQVNNINFIECEVTDLISGIYNKCQLFVVLPDSSNFYRLKSEPDYFLHFDQNNLDNYISKQKETLDEAAKYIEDGGHILYAVNTLNRKEGQSVVYEFLSKNKYFTLVKEHQCFPYEKESDMMYYALLVKGNKSND